MQMTYNMDELRAAADSFERLNPGVRIVIETANDSFDLIQALQSDSPPDLAETGGLQVGDPEGLFVDLNSYLEPEDEADLYGGLLRAARHGGILPGLPIEVSPPLIQYNKQLFDEAGVPYPEEGWTWADMIEKAKRLTVRDERGIARRFGLGLGVDIEWFEPFVMRNGGCYVAPDGSTARGYADSDATIEALQLLVDAYRLHGVVRKPVEAFEPLSDGDDESAMTFAFMWDARHRLDDRYGVVGLPVMPGGITANMIYMGGAGVTRKSGHPELAWRFLRHYVLECHSWMPPINRSQAAARGLAEHRIWSRYLEELEHVRLSAFYLSKRWNAARHLVSSDLDRMIKEGADVAQTVRTWSRYG